MKDRRDPLKSLREIRFSIENNIKILSIERIISEFNKILLDKNPSKGIFFYYKIGLLKIILPELINIKGIKTIHCFKHKDNFYHTFKVVDNISNYSNNLWLKWAALLHDIGKYLTKKYRSNIGWTFSSHELIGAKMIDSIFKRLKFQNKKNIKYIKNIIKYSSRPITLISYLTTDSSIKKLLVNMGNSIEDLILLCKSDITTKKFLKKKQFKQKLYFFKNKIKKIEEKKNKFVFPLSGDNIMNILNINSCKEIGILKNLLKKAIIKGIIPNDFNKASLFIKKKGKEMGFV
ncbi:multifunctional tRNA nucleotidyl transferase/2'3'-cyclic phosphodiesterase/2'nucleotidase/phosphatase [Candidatus Karelsulcia muelleri]|nr:multifunctional tRNA nucleotidyl transferase/2'3'-cyclic phosphodiesterase/2'nucleotidase/phosphatase [Candidatus Karelsulcia muelleri]